MVEDEVELPERLLATEHLLALLTENPRRLVEITSVVAPAQLQTSPTAYGWSANDVLAHIRSCADVWGDCIAAIIAEDTPTLRAINPRTWIKRTNYRELQFQPSLRSFTKQRVELLSKLEPLPPKGWSRSATVTGAGSVLVRTVHFYAQWLARHERTHVKQIGRIVGRTHK
jgi:DinB superfamily